MTSTITPVSTWTSTSTSTSTSTATSTSTSTKPKSSSFWSRELMFSASPHPSQLQSSRQIDVAPMCPCHDCWEYGSHALAPPRPPKAPKALKTKSESKTTVFSEKMSPLHFLKRLNSSKDSVVSDLRPLQQPVNLASATNSVYSMES